MSSVTNKLEFQSFDVIANCRLPHSWKYSTSQYFRGYKNLVAQNALKKL